MWLIRILFWLNRNTYLQSLPCGWLLTFLIKQKYTYPESLPCGWFFIFSVISRNIIFLHSHAFYGYEFVYCTCGGNVAYLWALSFPNEQWWTIIEVSVTHPPIYSVYCVWTVSTTNVIYSLSTHISHKYSKDAVFKVAEVNCKLLRSTALLRVLLALP